MTDRIETLYRIGVVLLVLTLVSVAVVVVVVTWRVDRSVQRDMAIVDCATSLVAGGADTACASLDEAGRKKARARARCIEARESARRAGRDPEGVCTFTVVRGESR